MLINFGYLLQLAKVCQFFYWRLFFSLIGPNCKHEEHVRNAYQATLFAVYWDTVQKYLMQLDYCLRGNDERGGDNDKMGTDMVFY